MTTQKHCPVFEVLGELESLIYRCPRCGEKIEVFPYELNKRHTCPKCGKQTNFMKRARSQNPLFCNGGSRLCQ